MRRECGAYDKCFLKQNQWVTYEKNRIFEIVYYKDGLKHGHCVKINTDSCVESVTLYRNGVPENFEMVEQAIRHAYQCHFGEVRKGSLVPYIVHPLEVLGIVFGMGSRDQRLLSAAVLHDVLEDTEETYENLYSRFGSVADLVAEESEDKSKTWEERKRNTVYYLGGECVSYEAKVIALADKLSNIRAMFEDYKTEGYHLWERFNEKDPLKQKWYYRSVCDALAEFSATEEWKEFDFLIREIWGE